ncbi:MAG: polysaccharide export protein [Nitrospirae bacterium]|nr:polysaccharide export protein [Nitrospirota bacterium]
MKRIYLPAVCVLLLSLFIAGCGGSREVNAQRIDSEVSGDSKAAQLNALMLNSAMTQGVDPHADYVIGADDLLDIDVFQADELKRTVRVSSQGYIGLPLIGQIKAKGLTPVQLEKEMSERLGKYMQEPLVSVYVKEYKAQKIGVIGAVTSPQVYAVTGQRYLLEMLSMAGGLSRDAGTICYVLRPVNSEQPGASGTETLVVDLSELLEKGNMALNIPVFGGDVINVPKGGVVFVDGAVERPGVYQMAGKTTLVQAVVMAGGMKFEATKSEVLVYRDRGDNTREIIHTDYEAIKDGGKDDLVLKQNDIVVVPSNGFRSFLTGIGTVFRGAVGVGGGSVGVGR